MVKTEKLFSHLEILLPGLFNVALLTVSLAMTLPHQQQTAMPHISGRFIRDGE